MRLQENQCKRCLCRFYVTRFLEIRIVSWTGTSVICRTIFQDTCSNTELFFVDTLSCGYLGISRVTEAGGPWFR